MSLAKVKIDEATPRHLAENCLDNLNLIRIHRNGLEILNKEEEQQFLEFLSSFIEVYWEDS